jgi:hypothetical protein
MHLSKSVQVSQRSFLSGWTWGSWTMVSLGKWELKRKLDNERTQDD